MRSLPLAATALALAICAASTPAFASAPTKVFVRSNGNNLCDGTTNTAFVNKKSLHCAKKTIQAGIDAVGPHGTVHISAETYAENIIVPKSVLISGAGIGKTIVQPAVSSPNPCEDSSLCGKTASNVFLVRSSDVTIRDLTINGDNPKLKHGLNVGGANIDARNGIIEDHLTGTYDRLTVEGVEVKNVFLRGINAGSGGNDFRFQGNKVTNVQGSTFSVGIFAFDARGTIHDNQVRAANDGISVNYSRGLKITANNVKFSGSGIHIDNNKTPASGVSQDLIQNNTVEDCTLNGYGIWLFVPHANALVDGNTVSNCDVGLAVMGGGAQSQIDFTDNMILGDSAADTTGIYVTTNTFGYGHFDTTAHFTGNTVDSFATGALVEQGGGKSATAAFDSERFQDSVRGIENSGTVSVLNSCLLSNERGLVNHIGGVAQIHTSGIEDSSVNGIVNFDADVLDASFNWWGNASGPPPVGWANSYFGNVLWTPPLISSPCD